MLICYMLSKRASVLSLSHKVVIVLVETLMKLLTRFSYIVLGRLAVEATDTVNEI